MMTFMMSEAEMRPVYLLLILNYSCHVLSYWFIYRMAEKKYKFFIIVNIVQKIFYLLTQEVLSAFAFMVFKLI